MSLCRLVQQEGLKKPTRCTYRHVELFCLFGDPLPASALPDNQVGKASGAGYMNSLLSRSNVPWRTTTIRKLLDRPITPVIK